MNKLKVHVLYEFGSDLRPHGSAYLRLIRPLSHPVVRDQFEVTFGRDLSNYRPDLVLVDRLWNPSNPSFVEVEKLTEAIRARKAKLVYCFDDDFLGLETGAKGIKQVHKECFTYFLQVCEGILVTTESLKRTYQDKKDNIVVLPNVLDERLLVRKAARKTPERAKVVIGYMGTATHDEDLGMVLPVLTRLSEKYPDRIQFEVIGALENRDLKNWNAFKKLEFKQIQIRPGESEYPLFMVWFTSRIRWDIGVAPLVDNPFNRNKSDIKYLDYSAAGIPGVYSHVPAYSSTVSHGETGFLANNDENEWFEVMDEMVGNPDLRLKVAQESDAYLYGNRVMKAFGKKWADALVSFC